MQTHQIYLTPISPIHIGCGEDFEPTNYIIDGDTLYYFDPANLGLNEVQRKKLLNLANRLDLLAIQRFFLEHKEKAISAASYFSNVAEGLASDYKNKIGKVAQQEHSGNKVINQFEIERTAYLPLKQLPYIPGSGFKGALSTALLDKFHQEKNNPKVSKTDHRRLLQEYIGEFAESKLRFVKFSDFIPCVQTESKIYYALNFKKKAGKSDGKGRAMALRRECISGGQYRVFSSELTLYLNEKNKMSIADYFSLLKKFYLPIFKQETEMLIERNLVNPPYLKQLEVLFNLPNVAVIRLGKNGADSKTYQGENIAQIKIMGANKMPPKFKDSSTTVWLAGTNQKQQNNLLPFGWAIIEFDPKSDNEALKKWCEAQPKSTFDRTLIIEKRESKKAEAALLKAQKEAEKQARLEEEKAKEAILNALSENQRLVETKLAEWSIQEKKTFTASPIFGEAKKLLEAAQQWNKEDRQYIYEKLDPTQYNEGLQKYVDGLNPFNKLKANSAVEFKKLRNKLVAE